jgi:FkbM family methyltransferase
MNGSSLLTGAVLFYGCRLPDHPRKWWIHERMREWVGQPVDAEVPVRRQGLLWRLNPTDYCQSELYWLGRKDSWQLHHLSRLLPAGAVVIDAGANYGYHAITLAKRRADCQCIHAIEPHPANYARLMHHVAANKLTSLVKCHRLAVAEKVGRCAMTLSPSNTGHARIVSESDQGDTSITTLDSFASQVGLDRLDALILDVEGFEERALLGAATVLERFRPMIMIELWPPVMKLQKSSVELVSHLLDGHGYRLFVAKRRRLVPLVELPTGDQGLYVLCIHPDHKLTVAA